MADRLATAASPYLRQHAGNPVDWWPWCDEAFEAARSLDLPLFISIGYSSCHWCHVMAHESFENDQIAAFLNDHFVSIKVDREERPDVDSIYMDAVQAISGGGGWPMSIFALPDGRPFFAGTYFPPADRMGRPGFRKILEAITEMWQAEREEIDEQAGALTEAIRRQLGSGSSAREAVSEGETGAEVFSGLTAIYDSSNGGFGGAPKFPQAMSLSFCLAHSTIAGEETGRAIVDTSLRKMALGGIYDQVGGGFARYSVDAKWTIPHFEKMLYDNALLARLYLWAGVQHPSSFFTRIATETLDYLLREMKDGRGGFYSSTDADSDGGEGRYFTWSLDEFKSVTRELGEVAAEHFGVDSRGNFEGLNVLAAREPLEELDPQTRQSVVDARSRLFDARSRRNYPALDGKVIAAWNGLALSAFADAGRVLDRDDYRSAATANAAFITDEMRSDGRLSRIWHEGVAGPEGFASDYALAALGLVSVFEMTGEWSWLEIADEMATALLDRFIDAEDGLPFTSDRDELIARPKDVVDNAEPSAASGAAELFYKLGRLVGNDRYEEAARRIAARLAPLARRSPSAFGNLARVAMALEGEGVEIVIAGQGSEAERMRSIAASRYLPGVVLAPALGGVPDGNPLAAGRVGSDAPAAYLCHGYECELPVHTGGELESAIDRVFQHRPSTSQG